MPAHTDPHSDASTPSTPSHTPVLDFSGRRAAGAPQSTAVLSRSELERYLAAFGDVERDLPGTAA